MNEQLQTELLKIVTNINNGVESAWGFLTEQTPEIIQQLLIWYLVDSALGLGIAISIAIAVRFIFLKYVKSEKSTDEGRCIGCIVSWVCVFCCFIWGICCLSSIVKLWIAPKVWLLEYITAMVK